MTYMIALLKKISIVFSNSCVVIIGKSLLALLQYVVKENKVCYKGIGGVGKEY